ncbi:hypothetical protein CARUB_v10023835mg [Capsella rubella]|uniref:Uncharacterized protein n=2 Tax=Capsella rubella TaxID=81985 RepID=R0HUB4_9BRAS|nr:hypothetical protein CARUB_v10023835mg [Capsella rubella]
MLLEAYIDDDAYKLFHLQLLTTLLEAITLERFLVCFVSSRSFMARSHQFRVDLGYGVEEMGFRSHLFDTAVGGFNSLSRRNHRDHPYVSDVVVDTLSDQFSSLSLLPTPKPIPTPVLPSSLQQSFRSKGLKTDQRSYGERLKLEAFYELHLSRIRKNESQQDRAKVLQRQEARLHNGGLVHRNCNVLRESKGTGVFHPLQRPATKTVTSVETVTSVKKRTEQRKANQSEKELFTKEGRGVMTTTRQDQQQQKDECHYHLPPDMDFSKDWAF